MTTRLGKPILMTMNMLSDPRLPKQTETAIEIIKASSKRASWTPGHCLQPTQRTAR